MRRGVGNSAGWTCLLLACTAIALTVPAPPAAAQASGSASAGAELARAWCSECHEVEPGPRSEEPSLLPAFRDVAADPAMTEMAFRVFLRTPHGGMPDIRVTPEQAGDLYAYLELLRQMGAKGR